jgi:hypothetical protein
MFRLMALIAMLGLAAQTPPPARPEALTAADLSSALAWAATGSPGPYPLRNGDGRTVGVVYTPYVRAAVAARVARDEGHALTADQVTPADLDPMGGESHRGWWWYIGLRLDVTTYLPGEQDFDAVLVSGEEVRAGHLDVRLAMPGGLTRAIGRGSSIANRSLRIGMRDDHVFIVVAVDPARLRAHLPARIVAIDRMRGADQVIVEGVITARDVAAWR